MISGRSLLCLVAQWQVIFNPTGDISRENKQIPSFVTFPPDWHITFTENHWSNERNNGWLLGKNNCFLYIDKKHQELHIPRTYQSLVIFSRFRGQCTKNILEMLEAHHILVVTVAANCTDQLQALDISVNKAAKEFLRSRFQELYSE